MKILALNLEPNQEEVPFLGYLEEQTLARAFFERLKEAGLHLEYHTQKSSLVHVDEGLAPIFLGRSKEWAFYLLTEPEVDIATELRFLCTLLKETMFQERLGDIFDEDPMEGKWNQDSTLEIELDSFSKEELLLMISDMHELDMTFNEFINYTLKRMLDHYEKEESL